MLNSNNYFAINQGVEILKFSKKISTLRVNLKFYSLPLYLPRDAKTDVVSLDEHGRFCLKIEHRSVAQQAFHPSLSVVSFLSTRI
jgi:hypothetical protein